MNPKTHQFLWSSQTQVRELWPWLEEIRKALVLKFWYVTDLSKVSDFALSKAQLRELEQDLGVPVSNTDLLITIARRMRKHITGRD